jgi:hypothetical protein
VGKLSVLSAGAYRGFSVTHPPSKALKAGRLTKNDDSIPIKTSLILIKKKQLTFKAIPTTIQAL